MPSRRRVLLGLGAGLATASFSHLWAPRSARASDLSLSDRIDLLYSNQFHFNTRGEPQITVGVMQGRTEVRLSCSRAILVLPSGDGGTSIRAGERFTVRLVKGEAAKQRFSVVLDELKGPAARGLDKAAARWKGKGLDPADVEVGTVFGVGGHVLDNRRMLLTTGSFSSERVARQRGKELADDHGALGKLHPIIESRSEGSIVARDAESGVEVHADGVLWFTPADGGSITVHGKQDRTYRGSIYVAIDRRGKLAVVNLVSETDVLAGLVPAEIYASAPLEALKAQAVAARGQLVSKIGTRHHADPFLLCSEVHCQVYAGQHKEHPRTTKAVKATAGRVAMRPGGTQLVDTVYSANSGGHTEHNDVVWPGPPDPQLRGRPDPLVVGKFKGGIDQGNVAEWLRAQHKSYSVPQSDRGKAAYRWTETLDPAALDLGVGKVEHLGLLSRGPSGRATTLRVVGSKRTTEIRGELRIRRALGGLRSSLFIVDPDRDAYGRFVLHGGGHGHGVGLCQHGAMGMAAAGKSYDEIIRHYYTAARASKLW